MTEFPHGPTELTTSERESLWVCVLVVAAMAIGFTLGVTLTVQPSHGCSQMLHPATDR